MMGVIMVDAALLQRFDAWLRGTSHNQLTNNEVDEIKTYFLNKMEAIEQQEQTKSNLQAFLQAWNIKQIQEYEELTRNAEIWTITHFKETPAPADNEDETTTYT